MVSNGSANTPTHGDVDAAARVLFDFHTIYDTPQPVDVIIGLGSYDLRVADRCAELYVAGIASRILFTGAAGNWTADLFGSTEAAAFAEVAQKAGVDPNDIVLEPEATNIGQNIAFASALLPSVTSALFVTKPQTQKRCWATVAKQWPEVQASVTAPTTRFEDQPLPHHPWRALVCEMVGDLVRLQQYPSQGFQVAVAIPAEVEAAFHTLVAAGFTDHMPR